MSALIIFLKLKEKKMNTDNNDFSVWVNLFQILTDSDPDAMKQVLELVYNGA